MGGRFLFTGVATQNSQERATLREWIFYLVAKYLLDSAPLYLLCFLFYSDDGDNIGLVYVGSVTDSNYIELRFKDKPPTEDMNAMRLPVLNWITNDPFPETLP